MLGLYPRVWPAHTWVWRSQGRGLARGRGDPVSRSLMSRGLNAIFSRVNKKRQWHELPTPALQALNLLSLRLDLRDLNLFAPPPPIRKQGLEDPPAEALGARRPDGKWNDLNDPEMGSVDSEFTRNIDPKRIRPEKPPRLHEPSARKVSLELMTRREFQPATTLNVLAAAWIQFENHNWFFHGRGKEGEVMEVPLPEGDDSPAGPMSVRRAISTPANQGGAGSSNGSSSNGSGVHGNTETHWWDGSQL